MSEYQYYEFQAIDRPLGEADRAALRALSTRARITATGFSNTYEWGDFKGDPAKLMARWFDLHLYLANWGTRRLMIRLPRRLIDQQRLEAFLQEVDCAELAVAGDNLILDMSRQDVEPDDEWDDGSGRLAALAPLRADVLAGDLRLFYLLWLTAVETDVFEPDEPEPLPGIGPMTGALKAFADFFGIDPDLVAAAAERAPATEEAFAQDVVRPIIAGITDDTKISLLMRLFEGDPHAAHTLRALVRRRLEPGGDVSPAAPRTVGELRSRAQAIRLGREKATAEAAAAEHRRRAQEAENVRRAHLDAIARRGESVWREVETEIGRRSAAGYDKAVSLLLDLKTVAEERGTVGTFIPRLRAIRERHARKGQFVERLRRLE